MFHSQNLGMHLGQLMIEISCNMYHSERNSSFLPWLGEGSRCHGEHTSSAACFQTIFGFESSPPVMHARDLLDM